MVLAKQKEFTVGGFCEAIGMTRQGLEPSLERHTIAMNKIERICQLLSITPNYFFGLPDQAGGGNYAANISGGNTQNSTESIKALKDQLKEKDKQINRLISLLEKSGFAKSK